MDPFITPGAYPWWLPDRDVPLRRKELIRISGAAFLRRVFLWATGRRRAT